MMDKSETFIKMCEKATEIQEHFSKDLAVRYRPDNAGYLMDSNLNYLYRHKLGDTPIWLPRQDQLVEMFRGWVHDSTPRKLVKGLWDWIATTAPPSDYSMEQLWLCFLMYTRYEKKWNGEEWVYEE